jgi:hypothetical protein
MTTRSQPNLPPMLPATACVEMDFFRDYVGEGREYSGHNGECTNCGVTFRESDDSDLATAHWMHRRAVARAIWERDEPADVRKFATLMDPDDPMDATVHARNLLAAGPKPTSKVDELWTAVAALIAAPDDTQWWPVEPYVDPPNDGEAVEVPLVKADRLREVLNRFEDAR